MRRLLALLLLVLAAGCAARPGPPAPPHDAPAFPDAAPAFAFRHVANASAHEPTLALDARGRAYFFAWPIDYDGPALGDASNYPSAIHASDDGGVSWRELPRPALALQPRGQQAVGSGDPFLFVDRATDRLYAADLAQGLYCSHLTWSDDGGQTWSAQPFACGLPVNDHPSLFAAKPATLPTQGYPSILYHCFNQVAAAQCSRSLDGGLTWLASRPVSARPVDADAARADPLGAQDVCSGLAGRGAASPLDGTAYVPLASCAENLVAMSRDDGTTWDVRRVSEMPTNRSARDPALAVDAAGTAYDVFTAQDLTLRLAVSRDHGQTWSAPANVSPPGARQSFFARVVAGSAGRVAILSMSSADAPGPDARWSAYVTIGVGADGPGAHFATAQANPPGTFLARGDCSGRCGSGTMALGDYLDLAMDPRSGRVWAALVDLGGSENRAAVAVQTGGATLLTP